MPRKPFDGAPLEHEGKESDETRKEVFGGSGARQGKGAVEEGDEQPSRHSNSPSEGGSSKQPSHPQNT